MKLSARHGTVAPATVTLAAAVLATVVLGPSLGVLKEPPAALAAGTFPPPTFYDEATRTRYAALGDSGFVLLDAGKTADAIATFTEMETVIPGGPWGNYNIAIAHGRAGETDQALAALRRAIDAGFDNTRVLRSEPDLEGVRLLPGGAELLRQTEENSDRHLADLSSGLPAVQPFPVPVDSLDALVSRELRRIYDQAITWHQWQLRQAVVNFRARQLESLRLAKKDDPTFDYALNRVRILASVATIGERWGVLANGVRKEAKAYLAGRPTPAGQAEASYDLAVALCRRRPEASSPAGAADAVEARKLFARVDSTSAQGPAAAAWRLALDLMGPDETKERLRPMVREFVSRYWSDPQAKAVADAFLKKDLIDAYWPISLDATDLDGQPVSLDQYRGKLLLVDFWATWCMPCRKELPALREAYARYHDRGLEILSISLDFPQAVSPAKYRDWVTASGMNWRHVYDQKGFQGPIPAGFFIYSIPSAFLIGRDGRPVAMSDDLRGRMLARTIEKAL
jgi:thiol-disulfide isomerase/thioredoxin